MSLGIQMMLKSMGIDMEEIQNYGRQAGTVVTDFRDRLERIESDLQRLILLMEKDHERRHDHDEPEPPFQESQDRCASHDDDESNERAGTASWP